MTKEEICIKGTPVSKGLVCSSVIYFQKEEEHDIDRFLTDEEVRDEIFRYRIAIRRSCRDIRRLQRSSFGGDSAVVRDILDSHLEMLRDPIIVEEVEKKIATKKKTSEVAIVSVLGQYKKRFEKISDPIFRDRIYDITDISKRMLRHLKDTNPLKYFSSIPPKSIYVANEITPSEVLQAAQRDICALISEKGGAQSHAGIIARARSIPYVTNIDISRLCDTEIEEIIIDAIEGKVIINPKESSKKRYERKRYLYQNEAFYNEKRADLPCHTEDSRKITLYANIESDEITQTMIPNCDGIGMFRTEFLPLIERNFPDEDRQFEIYDAIVCKIAPKPVTIRLFDLGADKPFFFPLEKLQKYDSHFLIEANPAFGCRGIRFLLRERTFLMEQLRAIVRAAKRGNVRILIPFVTDVEEVEIVRNLVQEIREEQKETIPPIPIGAMLEVPSAAILADLFARFSDFLSIGTNDLFQFLFASDRQSPQRKLNLQSIDLAILRLLLHICRSVEKENKEVSLCGEIASEITLLPQLIGLGITHFSVSPVHMARMKKRIRKISYQKEKEKIEKLLF